jgi:hypothetical protein
VQHHILQSAAAGEGQRYFMMHVLVTLAWQPRQPAGKRPIQHQEATKGNNLPERS